METLTKEFTTDLTEDSTWIFNTPGELTKSFLLYAQELGYFKASSNYYTCQENISSYLIMLTLAGQGTLPHPEGIELIQNHLQAGREG